MLTLISKSVFVTTGSAQCSQDIIETILMTNRELAVVSLDRLKVDADFLNTTNSKLLHWMVFHKPPYKPKFESNITEYIKQTYWEYKYPNVNKNFKKKINEVNITHIIVNSLGSIDLFDMLKLSTEIPATIVVHESPTTSSYYIKEWTVEWLKKTMKRFSYFIFVSENVRKAWVTEGIVNEQNSFYIPNTIKEDITEKLLTLDKNFLRKELRLPLDKKIIICVAHCSYIKGYDILLNAFYAISKKYPDLILVFVGGSSENNEILNSIGGMNYNQNVVHIDRVSPEKSLAYLASSDIFVLPSRAEAMPRVILEAMALRKPIIASNVGGIPELITHQQEGLIFEINNTEDFKIVLDELLCSEDKQQLFAENAYKKYWSSFSKEKYTHQWDKILKKITSLNIV